MTTFTVVPQQIVSSEDLTSHSIQKRGCQFNFEGSLSLFQNYHQDGCMFECLLEKSYFKTNCTPIFYPQFKVDQQTCHRINVKGFEDEMKSPGAIRTCQGKCPQECTKTLYTSSTSTEPLDIEGICNGFGKYSYFNPFDFEMSAYPRGILRGYEQIVRGKNMSNTYEFCKRAMERIAVVRVKLSTNTVSVIKRSNRVTIAGQIANIGKLTSI